jgi:Zn-dependent peptidase ImmA (M78 family)
MAQNDNANGAVGGDVRRRIKSATEALLAHCYSAASIDPQRWVRVPVELIADRLVKWTPAALTQGASIRGIYVFRANEDGQIWVDPLQSEAGRRYALAHELGHFLIHRQPMILAPYLDLIASSQLEEKLAHEFAGGLLVPTATLRRLLSSTSSHAASLTALETIAGQLGVSLPLLVKRAGEIPDLAPNDWFSLTASTALSAKRRSSYALRVQTRLLPKRFFLPLNRRLASVGLGRLVERFSTVEPFSEEAWSGDIVLTSRTNWRDIRVNYSGSFKKYVARSKYSYLALIAKLEPT